MDILALFITVVGLAVWLGSAIFVTFSVSPVINRRLPPSKVAEVMEQITPRFHWQGVAAAILMLLGGGGALFTPRIQMPTIVFMVLTGVALSLSLYTMFVIQPRVESLRQRLQSSAGSEENFHLRERYDHATRLTSFIGGLVLIILLGAAAALAAMIGPTPK